MCTRLLNPSVRLLTLTGPPGTGKTRLAVAAAAEVAGEFDDGAWFVALETVREPDGVIAAVAWSLDVPETDSASPLDGLISHLADRDTLLVLDNFEQVLPAAAQVAALLRACPGVTVLVTSRAALRLRWEHVFSVPALVVPDAGHQTPDVIAEAPSVALFVQRAQTVRPDRGLTEANAAEIASICALLDGLPLAIELAAARTRLLTTREIRDRLDHRLRLLTSGGPDVPDRHRTLRAALAWSYELLDPAEQRLLRRLAVFVGGCALAAAEAVCGDLSPTPPLAGEGS